MSVTNHRKTVKLKWSLSLLLEPSIPHYVFKKKLGTSEDASLDLWMKGILGFQFWTSDDTTLEGSGILVSHLVPHLLFVLQSGTTWYGQQPWEASDKDKLEMETQVDWGATNSTTHHEVEPPPAYDDVTGSPQQPTQQQQQQPEEQLQVVKWHIDSNRCRFRFHYDSNPVPVLDN